MPRKLIPDPMFLRWSPDSVRKLFLCQDCRAVYDGGWPSERKSPQELFNEAREALADG